MKRRWWQRPSGLYVPRKQGMLPPIAGGASWGFVAGNSGFQGTPGGTATLAFGTNPTTPGNTLIFVVSGASSGFTWTGMADTYGNTWAQITPFTSANPLYTLTAFVAVNRGGSGTNTCSVSTGVSSTYDTVTMEFSGGLPVIWQDGGRLSGNVTSGTTITIPTFISSGGDLLICSGVGTGSVTFNSPWNAGFVNSNGNGASYILNASGNVAANITDSSSGARSDIIFGLLSTPRITPRRGPFGM